jgi:signal transduction histidine kinase
MEDDQAQALLVQKCLERAGYTVETAPDGAAGLAKQAVGNFDVVIVDQTMPGISGLEVVRAMAARGQLPPTIMVTGTGNERVAVEAMKLGLSDYLIKDIDGGFVNVLPLVVARAIQRRRMMMEKQRMERELVRSERLEAIGQLAAGIAHEINTPIQYIGDNARFLQGAFGDIAELLDGLQRLLSAARHGAVADSLLKEIEAKLHAADVDFLAREIPLAIEQSLEGLSHVANIVVAMREFSHPANGQKQPVDLNRAIHAALTLSRGEWKHAAELTTELDAEMPPVCCYPTDVNRVVMNLVVNAAQAVAQASSDDPMWKGRICVRTRYEHPWAEIRVEDNGPGIPEKIRSRVFDLFFTTKPAGQGTGQGLAIAHNIVVEKHGGTIHFEDNPGGGTVFIVRLPVDGIPVPLDNAGNPAVPLMPGMPMPVAQTVLS